MAKTEQIDIIDRKGHVDKKNYKCHLKKSNGDQAAWVSKDGRTIIHFASSPFKDSVFFVPDGGSVFSGPPVNGVVGQDYKYNVDGPDGSADPIIVIDP